MSASFSRTILFIYKNLNGELSVWGERTQRECLEKYISFTNIYEYSNFFFKKIKDKLITIDLFLF